MTNSEKRILIVDDQIENVNAIFQMLEKAGVSNKISLATSAQQAYQVINKYKPDLIITDWEMPEVNGIDFIKELKEKDLTKNTPIIMCTGVMTSSKNLEIALEAGATDYIRKPVDEIELIARVKANLHLSEKYHEIKELNDSKDTIFSILSHDLKGAVGQIKALVDIAEMSKGKISIKELYEFIRIIGKQNRSVFLMLENLLSWAKNQKHFTALNLQKYAVNDAISENLDLLHGLSSSKNISIVNAIPDDLEATFDLNMLSAVFRNLISNAIKFTPEGGSIELRAEKHPNVITFAVIDNGIGIHPGRINDIFSKTTFDSTYGTKNESGTGLGLKICQEFIEKHGGKIWVESTVGKGSTFKLNIARSLE